jgi:anti-sigma-K factor RskA
MTPNEPKFDNLMREYKDACPEPDGSAAFLPGLWGRIEAQKRALRSALGWTSAYVTVAAVICLLLVVLIAFEAGRTTRSTYVEVLDNSQDASVLEEAASAN